MANNFLECFIPPLPEGSIRFHNPFKPYQNWVTNFRNVPDVLEAATEGSLNISWKWLKIKETFEMAWSFVRSCQAIDMNVTRTWDYPSLVPFHLFEFSNCTLILNGFTRDEVYMGESFVEDVCMYKYKLVAF